MAFINKCLKRFQTDTFIGFDRRWQDGAPLLLHLGTASFQDSYCI
jgi:hypothetical protein